jgi:hypothetical protein
VERERGEGEGEEEGRGKRERGREGGREGEGRDEKRGRERKRLSVRDECAGHAESREKRECIVVRRSKGNTVLKTEYYWLMIEVTGLLVLSHELNHVKELHHIRNKLFQFICVYFFKKTI